MHQSVRFVTSGDGARIACASTGSGSPLVKAPTWLSHLGMDGESPVWRHWWEELSRDHLFIRFDQRGSGLSDRDVKDFSLHSWVSDLESVVEAYHLRHFDLVGMSQGGPIAVEYARRHPERVDKLVIIGGYSRGWAKRGQDDAQHRALLKLIETGWGSDNPAFRQVFTSQFIPDATREQMSWFNDLERVSSSPENAVLFQQEVGEIDVVDSATQVRAPTLVFHSRQDARVPFDEGRRLAALIPGARFVALDSKNHILLEEEPAWKRFVTELRAFLAEPNDEEQAKTATFTLTPREIEVLQLVAEGLTDRQIAEHLSLSVRTVGNHVKNILNKTGSANRTSAAILAAKNDLL